jgi:hypothetical protein
MEKSRVMLDVGEEAGAEEAGGVEPAMAVVDADERGVREGKHLSWSSMARLASVSAMENSPAACGRSSIGQSMPSATAGPGGQCPQHLATALSIILTTTPKSSLDTD